MGFGTNNQIGNRTSLADIFRNNIGAPQQLGTTQQPNQLFTLLQSLLGGGGQPGMQPPQAGGPGGPGNISPPGLQQQFGGGGNTPLSAITAQPPQFGDGTNLTNPFGSLINQRFVR